MKNYISLSDKQKLELKNISDSIWDFSELKFKEYKSAKLLMDYLKEQGFKVEESKTIPNAFTATYGNSKPVIGLLAEYDALSNLDQMEDSTIKECSNNKDNNNGHGCGHHLLGAGVVGAAILSKSYIQKYDKGTVVLYGCPGEEGGSGKAFMAKEGMFNNLDIAYTWHPGNFNAVMAVDTLANYQVYFKFKGRAAHAAAAPHLGRSALDAVELMNVGVNYLREHIPSDARVHYAITNSGGISPNVVQAEAEVLYLIRSPHLNEVASIYERVIKIAKGASLMTETEVEVVFDKGCSDYKSNRVLDKVLNECMNQVNTQEYDDSDLAYTKKMYDTLTSADLASDIAQLKMLSLEDMSEVYKDIKDRHLLHRVYPLPKTNGKLPGSTDVGDVSKIVPVSQLMTTCFTIGTPMHSWQLVSQGKSNIAYKGMYYAAEVLASAVVKSIEDDIIIKEAKLEHKRVNDVYICPIPDGVVPKP